MVRSRVVTRLCWGQHCKEDYKVRKEVAGKQRTMLLDWLRKKIAYDQLNMMLEDLCRVTGNAVWSHMASDIPQP